MLLDEYEINTSEDIPRVLNEGQIDQFTNHHSYFNEHPNEVFGSTDSEYDEPFFNTRNGDIPDGVQTTRDRSDEPIVLGEASISSSSDSSDGSDDEERESHQSANRYANSLY